MADEYAEHLQRALDQGLCLRCAKVPPRLPDYCFCQACLEALISEQEK